MIKLEITPENFHELIKKGYDLEMVYILKLLEIGEDISTSTPKMISLELTMVRKGLITPERNITEQGKELVKCVSSGEKIKITRKKLPESKDDGFTLWWKTFPGTDTFEYKNRKFIGTRALRTKKDDCRVKIEKILKEGEITIDELIGALKLEIQQKMENSIKTGVNKMSYFQNSLTYLHQRTFEPYVELLKAGHKPEETKTTNYGGIEV